MRDVIFALMIFGLLPVCYRRPLIGLLTFSWLAYMRTQDLTWGFARRQRWSFLVAGVTAAGYFSGPRQPIRLSSACRPRMSAACAALWSRTSTVVQTSSPSW